MSPPDPDLQRSVAQSKRRVSESCVRDGLDRLPPHSSEAEQGVLGCCLLDPVGCVAQAQEAFKVGAEVFYDLRHREVFTAMAELMDEGTTLDVITLQQRLKDKQRLDEVGGIAYLAALPDAVPSAANLSYYLDIVVEKHLLRSVIKTCTEVVGRVYDWEGDVESLLDQAEREVLAVRGMRNGHVRKDMHGLVLSAIAKIEDMHQRKGAPDGLATGFVDWDKLTGGLHDTELSVLAGFPSQGKTALAMNVVEHVAIDQKFPVGVFSLEMSAEMLTLRMLCSNARVNLRDVHDGFMVERDFPKLTAASGRMDKAGIYWEDVSDLTIMQLRAKGRRMRQQYGVRLIVVDYLQLVDGGKSGRRDDNREQEVSGVARGLKAMAMELKVPVLALSQLNDDGKLRESRAIGQHGDNVYRLHKAKDREAGGEFEDLGASAVPLDLLVLKQKNGPTGKVPLTFLKCFTRFESAARVSDESVSG